MSINDKIIAFKTKHGLVSPKRSNSFSDKVYSPNLSSSGEDELVIMESNSEESNSATSSKSQENLDRTTDVKELKEPGKRKSKDYEPPQLTGNVDIFCWRCHKVGLTASCSSCRRVYHLKCAQLKEQPTNHWRCPECDEISRAENEEAKNKPGYINPKELCALLQHTIQRMYGYEGSEHFASPVDTKTYSDYLNFVLEPMDLSKLETNVKQEKYKSPEAFIADVKWMVHNSYIYNSVHSELTLIAKGLFKISKQECEEIVNCPDCYEHAHTLEDKWFIEPCTKPHIIVWARLKGFPYWPGKVMKVSGQDVDIRFFGDHNRSMVPIQSCYLFSKLVPSQSKIKRPCNIEEGLEEVKEHIKKLEEKYRKFIFPPHKTPYEPKKEDEHRQLMLPYYGKTDQEVQELCKLLTKNELQKSQPVKRKSTNQITPMSVKKKSWESLCPQKKLTIKRMDDTPADQSKLFNTVQNAALNKKQLANNKENGVDTKEKQTSTCSNNSEAQLDYGLDTLNKSNLVLSDNSKISDDKNIIEVSENESDYDSDCDRIVASYRSINSPHRRDGKSPEPPPVNNLNSSIEKNKQNISLPAQNQRNEILPQSHLNQNDLNQKLSPCVTVTKTTTCSNPPDLNKNSVITEADDCPGHKTLVKDATEKQPVVLLTKLNDYDLLSTYYRNQIKTSPLKMKNSDESLPDREEHLKLLNGDISHYYFEDIEKKKYEYPDSDVSSDEDGEIGQKNKSSQCKPSDENSSPNKPEEAQANDSNSSNTTQRKYISVRKDLFDTSRTPGENETCNDDKNTNDDQALLNSVKEKGIMDSVFKGILAEVKKLNSKEEILKVLEQKFSSFTSEMEFLGEYLHLKQTQLDITKGTQQCERCNRDYNNCFCWSAAANVCSNLQESHNVYPNMPPNVPNIPGKANIYSTPSFHEQQNPSLPMKSKLVPCNPPRSDPKNLKTAAPSLLVRQPPNNKDSAQNVVKYKLQQVSITDANNQQRTEVRCVPTVVSVDEDTGTAAGTKVQENTVVGDTQSSFQFLTIPSYNIQHAYIPETNTLLKLKQVKSANQPHKRGQQIKAPNQPPKNSQQVKPPVTVSVPKNSPTSLVQNRPTVPKNSTVLPGGNCTITHVPAKGIGTAQQKRRPTIINKPTIKTLSSADINKILNKNVDNSKR